MDMEMDFTQLATKVDLKTAFDSLRYELKSEIADTRRTLALEIVKTQAEIREIKETMATKADMAKTEERIIKALDGFAGQTHTFGRDTVLHGQVLTEIQVELKEHDGRIKRLESGS